MNRASTAFQKARWRNPMVKSQAPNHSIPMALCCSIRIRWAWVSKGPSVTLGGDRSEEHTSELQSHSFISYAVFCLKKKIPHTRAQHGQTFFIRSSCGFLQRCD